MRSLTKWTVILSVTIWPTCGVAQDFRPAPVDVVQLEQDGDWNARLVQFVEKQKRTWQMEMKTVLADIDRICQLSPEQKSKLEVAAKGAIIKSIRSLREEQKRLLQGVNPLPLPPIRADRKPFPTEVVGVVPPALPPIKVEKNDIEIQTLTEQQDIGKAKVDEEVQVDEFEKGRGVDFIVVDGPPFPMPVMPGIFMFPENPMADDTPGPTTQPIWTTTLKQTLSDGQHGRYATSIQSRETKVREANLDLFISKVDLKLLLDEQQIEKLRELVTQQYGELMLSGMGETQGAFFPTFNENVNNREFLQKLEVLLTEAQLIIWKEKFQMRLDYGMLMERAKKQARLPENEDMPPPDQQNE